MGDLLNSIARWLGALGPYLLLGLLALAIAFALASISVAVAVLFWWAGWTSQHAERRDADAPLEPAAPAPRAAYLVYLSGIGHISSDYSTRYEDALLAAIAMRRPELAIIHDIFPFSVNNASMASERMLGWFWAWVSAQRARRGRLRVAGDLILLRNILYTAVSADRRYGPIYNYSVAELILQSLIHHGYEVGSRAPITLLGYSGGAQIGLAAAGYLKATLRAPVQMISLGGVINSSPAIDRIDRVCHLYGSRDQWQRFGALVFPARWRLAPRSRWNRGLASGKVVSLCIGPMVHQGRRSYLDDTALLASGQSYQARTADLVAELIGTLAL